MGKIEQVPGGLKWPDDGADNSEFMVVLNKVGRLATREGYCYHHVQAMSVSIDQYTEPLREIASASGVSRTRSLKSQSLEARHR